MGKLLWLFVTRIVANQVGTAIAREFVSPKTSLKQRVYGYFKSMLRPTDWMLIVGIGLFGFVAVVEALYGVLSLIEHMTALVGVWTHHVIPWPVNSRLLHLGPSIVSLWALSVGLVIISAVLWAVQVVKRLITIRTQAHGFGRVRSWVVFGCGVLLHVSTLVLSQG